MWLFPHANCARIMPCLIRTVPYQGITPTGRQPERMLCGSSTGATQAGVRGTGSCSQYPPAAKDTAGGRPPSALHCTAATQECTHRPYSRLRHVAHPVGVYTRCVEEAAGHL